jgi:hypothetical protein
MWVSEAAFYSQASFASKRRRARATPSSASGDDALNLAAKVWVGDKPEAFDKLG